LIVRVDHQDFSANQVAKNMRIEDPVGCYRYGKLTKSQGGTVVLKVVLLVDCARTALNYICFSLFNISSIEMGNGCAGKMGNELIESLSHRCLRPSVEMSGQFQQLLPNYSSYS
jgi:hypothetical protein